MFSVCTSAAIHFHIGSSGCCSQCAVGDFHQPLTATTADVYSNSSLQQANGRKPRSSAQLIPPPKFGVSITKPATHTVRFFLSDANSSTQEGEEREREEGAVVQLQTMSREETRRDGDRQMPFKVAPDKTTTTTTTPGGRDVGGGNFRSSSTGRRQPSPVKEQRIQNRTTSGASAASPTVVMSPSADRGPAVLLSSDCDSLLSVETIIPRTMPGNTTPDDDQRMTATPYSFLEDDIIQLQSQGGKDDLDERGMEAEELRRHGRVIVDPNEGRLSSSSGSAKRKKVNSPFPGPFPLSVVAKDGGKAASHPSSWQTHRHSYAKSKQQQLHYSSETSPSPGSPEELQDAVVSSPPPPPPPVKSATGMKVQGGPSRPPLATPVMAPGAWSITRSFGPSSVTVTPLGTHEPPSTGTHNERHIKGGDGAAQVFYHQQHHHHRHPQGGEFTLGKEPARREHVKGDSVDQYRSVKKDDPVGMWRSMERQRQQHHPAAADRHMPSPPHPPPAPAVLEITESKATVYDNVQYFQM